MVRIENFTLVPDPEGRARRRTPQPVTGKLSLPNPAKPIPISHAHSYGINRAYLTAKDGSSRSGSRADHERARITNARRAAEELFKPKPQAPGETAPIGGLLPLEDPAHVVAG